MESSRLHRLFLRLFQICTVGFALFTTYAAVLLPKWAIMLGLKGLVISIAGVLVHRMILEHIRKGGKRE